MKKAPFNFREWLIASTYRTPFINFIFSTQDFVAPKFVNFEEYRSNIQKYNEMYIAEPVFNRNIHTVKLMPRNEKIKYLLLDVGLSFNKTYANNPQRLGNLLIIVDETPTYFEIIFINTPELYEEDSYVVKRFQKDDSYFDNNMQNLSFLFIYYSLVTNGISVISRKKIEFLNSHNVYYLTIKEQKEIFKRTKPFESTFSLIKRFFIIIILFIFPIVSSNYVYFDYKTVLEKNIKRENNDISNSIQKLKGEVLSLQKEYKFMRDNVKDNRNYFNKDLK